MAQSCYWLLLAQCKISLKLSVLAFVETYSEPQNYKVLHNPSLNKYVGDWYNYINLENLDEWESWLNCWYKLSKQKKKTLILRSATLFPPWMKIEEEKFKTNVPLVEGLIVIILIYRSLHQCGRCRRTKAESASARPLTSLLRFASTSTRERLLKGYVNA